MVVSRNPGNLIVPHLHSRKKKYNHFPFTINIHMILGHSLLALSGLIIFLERLLGVPGENIPFQAKPSSPMSGVVSLIYHWSSSQFPSSASSSAIGIAPPSALEKLHNSGWQYRDHWAYIHQQNCLTAVCAAGYKDMSQHTWAPRALDSMGCVQKATSKTKAIFHSRTLSKRGLQMLHNNVDGDSSGVLPMHGPLLRSQNWWSDQDIYSFIHIHWNMSINSFYSWLGENQEPTV